MAKKKEVKKNQVKALQSHAKKQLTKAKANFNKAEKKVHTYMKEHPEKAALIAAGVGVAIGAAVAAAMKRKKR